MIAFHFWRSATASVQTADSTGLVCASLDSDLIARSSCWETESGMGDASSTSCSVVKISEVASEMATDASSESLSKEGFSSVFSRSAFSYLIVASRSFNCSCNIWQVL